MQQNTESSHPRVDSVLNAIAGWTSRYRRTRADRQAFSQCSPDEVAKIAHDIGVTQDELVSLAGKTPDSAQVLDRLLRALGVERVAHQDEAVMNDLKRLCIFCGEKQRCQHELAAGSAVEHFRQYCPNAFTLDTLITENVLQRRAR